MTYIGYLTLVLSVLIIFGSDTVVFSILFSVVAWTAATVINQGPVVWPFEVCLFFFILRSTAKPGFSNIVSSILSNKFTIAVGVVGYGLAAWSLVAPRIFQGMEVFSPRLGIDEQVEARSSLTLTSSNIAQAVYWFAHTTLLLVLLGSRGYYKVFDVMRGIRFGFYTIYFISIWQLIDTRFGGFYFPFEFFLNADYAIATQSLLLGQVRLIGTYQEASVYAGNLTAIAAFFLFDYHVFSRKFSLVLFAAGLILIAATVSTTGILAIILLFILFACVAFSRVKNRGWSFVEISSIASLMVIVMLFFYVSGSDYIQYLLIDKSQSMSGVNRFDADAQSFYLFRDTFGAGVGFGSHRSSSLLMNMLGCAGVIGALIYIYGIWKSFRVTIDVVTGKTHFFMLFGAATFCYLFCATISIPDANAPLLWLLAGIGAMLQGSPLGVVNLRPMVSQPLSVKIKPRVLEA